MAELGDDTPDIAAVAALIGEPSRARMLLALMGGRAITATELALEADVAPATASIHLSKLTAARLVKIRKQGRYRYFEIADELVAEMIERLCGVAVRGAGTKRKTGPRNPAMRRARVCYDHLAGELGVRLFEGLVDDCFDLRNDAVELTAPGVVLFKRVGIDIDALQQARRVMCRQCLDWSERKTHLAGSLGAALLTHVYESSWATKDANSRAVHFSAAGLRAFKRTFGLDF